MPPPQSADEVKAAIAAGRQHQRRAGFAGGEGVEGQAGAMVICSGWGVKVVADAHPVFDRHWCGRWDSNPHDVAIEGF